MKAHFNLQVELYFATLPASKIYCDLTKGVIGFDISDKPLASGSSILLHRSVYPSAYIVGNPFTIHLFFRPTAVVQATRPSKQSNQLNRL